ncbi:hypothetical protein B0H19DRAFT_1056703 [Mycena capillaripes]|nr:hypothetical protein B0H19DRAFT_1056703 [Mycena capillaripes]
MYFHNVATHCHPPVPSVVAPRWFPFSMSNVLPLATERTWPNGWIELYQGSEALPRSPRGRAGIIYLQPSSNGGDSTTDYVLSWPPSLATRSPSSASSASSKFSSATAYYTPPTSPVYSPITSTVSTPFSDYSGLSSPEIDSRDVIHLTDNGDCSAVLGKCSLEHRESRPKGLARLRPNAPPALRLDHKTMAGQRSCIPESDDEEGLVMLLWERPSAH